ncbi:MAG: aminoglycoside phosphotransferase [Herbinix sp.]|nr:aminoglycoside phosphotransferase [Herbinix sp.]
MEFEKIGLGATADVYRYNEKNIIKIFHENISEAEIAKECKINKTIQGLGINVPLFGGRTIIDGKQTIIMEYIKGKSMFHKMFEPDVDLIKLANDFAQLHYTIHKCKNIPLEASKTKLEKHIAYSEELEPYILDKVLRLLDTLPDGSSLCHNDFHPDNIIVSAKGLYIIDWCDSSCGDPLADVARTSLVFDCVALPDDVPKDMRDSINQARKYFGTLYEAAYANLIGVDTLPIMQWKVVEAAHRINCEAEENKPIFKKIIYDYFDVI